MYYTVINHSGHLRTLEKCRKHSPAARVFYISLVFSNFRRVLSQCNIRLRLLYLLNNYKMALIETSLFTYANSLSTPFRHPCHSSFFDRDHLRSTMGIISGPIWGSFPVRDHLRSNLGSFAVRDHLRSWDHLRTRTVSSDKSLPARFFETDILVPDVLCGDSVTFHPCLVSDLSFGPLQKNVYSSRVSDCLVMIWCREY